jgi:hypothetical protein
MSAYLTFNLFLESIFVPFVAFLCTQMKHYNHNALTCTANPVWHMSSALPEPAPMTATLWQKQIPRFFLAYHGSESNCRASGVMYMLMYFFLHCLLQPLIESNNVLAETIGKITVHCLYHRSGCPWQGPLSECTSHCSGCAFGNSPVVCNRCGIQIVHSQVQEHAQNCPVSARIFFI